MSIIGGFCANVVAHLLGLRGWQAQTSRQTAERDLRARSLRCVHDNMGAGQGTRCKCGRTSWMAIAANPNFSLLQEQNIVIYGKGFGVGLTFLDEAGQTLTNIEHL